MNYFTKRSYVDLLAAYGVVTPASAASTFLPLYAEQILAPLLGISLAEDFQVLSPDTLVNENIELLENKAPFSTDWLVFAYSGQGDFWLLHKDQNETGFYDHNMENYSLANVAGLRLKLEEWVEVADLFHQFDLLNETTPDAFTRTYSLKPAYKQEFKNKLDTINLNVLERLPFTNL